MPELDEWRWHLFHYCSGSCGKSSSSEPFCVRWCHLVQQPSGAQTSKPSCNGPPSASSRSCVTRSFSGPHDSQQICTNDWIQLTSNESWLAKNQMVGGMWLRATVFPTLDLGAQSWLAHLRCLTPEVPHWCSYALGFLPQGGWSKSGKNKLADLGRNLCSISSIVS